MITFSCYNYYTLFMAYSYTKECKSKYDVTCNLILRNNLVELPDDAFKLWDNIIELDDMGVPINNVVDEIKKTVSFNRIRKYRHVRKKLETNSWTKSNQLLVSFKDNNLYDSTIIDYFNSKNNKIILVEEGLGLYSSITRRKKRLKKMVATLLKMPKEIFLTQGENSKVDIVVCKHPEKLADEKARSKKVFLQTELFNTKYTQSFIRDVLGVNLESAIKELENIDSIYFSQALSEDRLVSIKDEQDALNKLFSAIPKQHKLIIKVHPRENRDKFNEILSKNPNITMISDELNAVPGEVFYQLLYKPVIITPYSSVASNIKNIDQSATIYIVHKYFDLDQNVRENIRKIYSKNKYKIVEKNELKINEIKGEKGRIKKNNEIKEIDQIYHYLNN